MSVIYYNLANATNLGPFVSAAAGAGWGAAMNHMPVQAGIYLIWNSHNNNFYVGIANDLNNRFGPRHESAVHLGLDRAYMQGIFAWHGNVQVYNTPAPPPMFGAPPPPPPALALNGPAGAVPAAQIGALSAVVNAPAYVAAVDGVAAHNLEAILIRFYFAINAFATNTNTQLIGPIMNTTGNPIHLYVNYAAVGATPAGSWYHNWAPGAAL